MFSAVGSIALLGRSIASGTYAFRKTHRTSALRVCHEGRGCDSVVERCAKDLPLGRHNDTENPEYKTDN